MNNIRITPVIFTMAIAIVFASSIPSTGQPTEPLARGMAVLKPEIITVAEPHRSIPEAATIFVIGENHASIRVQHQIAESLNALLEAGAIEALLVEGSPFGPIGRADLLTKLSQLAIKPELDSYWHRELEIGNLSGTDYIALVRPAVAYYGVEDMGAKKRFEENTAISTDRWLLRWQYESAMRALPLFDTAVNKLQTKVGQRELMPVLAQVREYREIVNRQQMELRTKEERDAESEKLETRLRPILPIIQKYQQASQKKDATQIASLERQLIQAIEKSGYDNPSQLQSDLKRLGSIRSEMDTAEESIASFETRAKVQYFAAANALRGAVAGTEFRFPEIETFLANEADRYHEAQDGIYTKSDFVERDRAMIANTRKYLVTSGHKSAALIVGYAHLEDITELLKAEALNFVTCSLTANRDNIEEWESDSWARRSGSAIQVFSNSLSPLKEVSHLLDLTWKREHEMMFQYFKSSQFEAQISKSAKGIPTSHNPFGPTATKRLWVWDSSALSVANQFGAHVVGFGSIPGHPEKLFQVYDRDAAKRLVNKLSDTNTVFGYYYRSETGAYQIQGPDGPAVSLSAFLASPLSFRANVRPKRVVLFGEPDLSIESGRNTAPFRRRIRETPPSGPGQPPPSVPGWTTATASQGSNGIPLYWTRDPQAAKRRLAAIDKEKPIGGVQITTQGKIEDLWFTPDQGEHAQVAVIVEKNTEEFRKNLAETAKSRKFENKQIALITCGDAFVDADTLKDLLLENGALMVWIPDRQIDVDMGNKLATRIAGFGKTITPEQVPQTIDGLVSGAIKQWKQEEKTNTDLKRFETAPTIVHKMPKVKLPQRNPEEETISFAESGV